MLNSLANVNSHLTSSAGEEVRRNIKIVIYNRKILNRRGKRYNPIAEQDEEIAHFKVHIFRKNHNFIKIDLE